MDPSDPTSRVTAAITGAPDPEPAVVERLRARGDAIGRYLVLRFLGRGGMGVVYEAFDPDLDRRVAVKVVERARSEGDRHKLRARLWREAKAMARVNHPNVVAVFDVGETEGGVFVAMDLVDGETLKAWLDREPRTTKEVLRAFAQAGRGLVAAHAVGLVHRDFKLENVLVSQRGEVRVTDFGLARLSDWVDLSSDPSSEGLQSSGGALSDEVTRPGAVIGTPAFMAPEMFQGAVADERSDQFSYCTALYLALFKQRPYEVAALREFAQNREKRPALRPIPAEPRLPLAVKRSLERGLALEASARFVSMPALLGPIERAVDRRGRTPRAIAAGALSAALVVGLVALDRVWAARAQRCTGGPELLEPAWNPGIKQQIGARIAAAMGSQAAEHAARVDGALERYSKKWLSMHREACEATTVRGEQSEAALQLRMQCLTSRLRELQSLTALLAQGEDAIARQSLDAVLGLTSVAHCADMSSLSEVQPLPSDPESRRRAEALSAELAAVNALRLAGDYRRGMAQVENAVAAAADLKYRPLEAQALYLKGALEERTGRGEDSERTLVAAANAADAARDDALKVRVAVRLVYAGSQSERLAMARHWEGFGTAALERSAKSPELEADLLSAVGTLQLQEGKLEESARSFRRALSLFQGALGADSSKALVALGNLANVELVTGRFQEAADHLAGAVRGIEALRGGRHPALIPPLSNLGQALAELGDFPAAHAAADRALAIAKERSGPTHPMTLNTIETKALVFLGERKFAQALDLFREKLALQQAALKPDDPLLAYALDGIGRSLIGLGRRREAVASLERALQLRASSPADRAATRYALAQLLAESAATRARARSLGEEAKREFESGGRADRARSVESWLVGLK